MPKRAKTRKARSDSGREQKRPAAQITPQAPPSAPLGSRLLHAAALAFPALFCLCLYVFTLAPTIVPGDSSEFIAAIHVLGVPHPTGYPLYMILGKIFELVVPFGSVALRINLFSAVCGAAMVALLSLLTLRVTGSRLAAVTAGLVGGLNESAWSQAVIAEVYTLHGIMVMLILLALLNWEQRRTWRAFTWLALAAGFGLAHHRAIVFVAAPALVASLALQRPFSWRGLARAAGAGAAPLAVYAYLPLRAAEQPIVNWGNTVTWANFWHHVAGSSFIYRVLTRSLASTLTRALHLFTGAAHSMSWPGVAGGLAGAVILLRKRPVLGAVTAASFLILLIWNSAYQDVVVVHFHLPTFLIMGLWLGVSVEAARAWVRARSQSRAVRRAADIAAWAVPPALLVLLALSNYEGSSRRDQWDLEIRARRTLAQMKPHALLVAVDINEIFSAWYLQAVHGMRRDVTVLQPVHAAGIWYLPTVSNEEVRLALADAVLAYGRAGEVPSAAEAVAFARHCTYLLAQRLAHKKAIYTFHPPNPLPPGIYALQHAMGLNELVHGEPKLTVCTGRAGGAELLPGLVLVRADLPRQAVPPLGAFRVTFAWHCRRPMPPGFTVLLGLQRAPARRAGAGRVIPDATLVAQALPLNYGLPLQPTPPGCEYRQTGVFVVEHRCRPGKYRVWVGAGRRGKSGRWELGPGGWAAVGEIRVSPARKGPL